MRDNLAVSKSLGNGVPRAGHCVLAGLQWREAPCSENLHGTSNDFAGVKRCCPPEMPARVSGAQRMHPGADHWPRAPAFETPAVPERW